MGGPSTPVVNTVIPSLSGAEGLGIDPVTGDLFISSYAPSILYRVDGFNTFTALAADHPGVLGRRRRDREPVRPRGDEPRQPRLRARGFGLGHGARDSDRGRRPFR